MRRTAIFFVIGTLPFFGCEGPTTDIVVPLGIINWYPSGGAICVPRETGVWLTFSEPVVVETLTESSANLSGGVDAVAVAREYDDETATLWLQPTDVLRFGTGYTITLSAGIAALSGGELTTSVTSEFQTLPQSGCALGLICRVDADCDPRICSVTGVCVEECAVPEDCPPGQVCLSDACVDG
ncbi:MAG: hypothetical protein A2341_02545 [Deltaproteobacteria bacterium RIFOXYB12_FULL_58_9]|nr:MAG: hypothetical protein A2341_02545 [Deltaproteobacteria bacterium RIFOXYB12_FULL_58_9]